MVRRCVILGTGVALLWAAFLTRIGYAVDFFDNDAAVAGDAVASSPAAALTPAAELGNGTHEIPADVRLLAAASRLLDFHQSRSQGANVSIPETPDTAGQNLFLATSVLHTLGRLELEHGQFRVSLKTLSSELGRDLVAATADEVMFCVASLATAREIRYAILTGQGKLVEARTSDTTTLLMYDPSLRQVSLTENARLLLRVTSLRESWLYSDVDAQRLIKAIQRGQYEDVPRFCREMVRDLAGKARQIADVYERPGLADVRDALIADGGKISASLSDAAQLVQAAMTSLFSEQTEADFHLWRTTRGVTFGLGNLQADLEIVLQSTESLSRRFVEFVKSAQRMQTVRAPMMSFLDMARSLTVREDGALAQIDAAMADVLPWLPAFPFFSPDLLSGEVDFTALLRGDDPKPLESAFESTEVGLATGEAMHEFLRRNAAKILAVLRDGPVPFSQLLHLTSLDFLPGEDQASLAGTFTYPEVFDANGLSIRIEHRHTSFTHESSRLLLMTSDPVLSLNESAPI